jgi:radical SAM superfamily enzyme YgiQ (UPF0313 family)
MSQLSHQTEVQFQNKCFPLAIGYLGSHLLNTFKDKIKVDLFKSPFSFNEQLEIKKPDVVMLSSYMWNENLTLAFAKRIKNKYPDVLIILGGPNISLDSNKREKFLRENPFLDLMVIGDGEFIAEEIIKEFLKEKNIEYLKYLGFPFTCSIFKGEFIEGTQSGEYRLGIAKDKTSMDEFPSPYLDGLFDKFFRDGESPLLETNRGCPFTCTYCQQGSKYFQKVRHFPSGRFKKEINYIANKIIETNAEITTIEMTDPNFGMFKRDEEICRHIRECQDKFDFPQFVGSSTGKNNAATIIKNTSILKEGSIFLRSSMQSLNMDALKAVKRQNIKLDAYKKMQDNARERGLDSNADMMLGFPNETYQSHIDGILTLLDSRTKEFAQYQTIVLKGTEFEKQEYLDNNKIKTKHRVIPECFNKYNILGEELRIVETEEIIIETATMTFNEYIKCRVFNLIIMVYHNSRLLDLIYEYTDSLQIKRSDLINAIFNFNGASFLNIVEDYCCETENELFVDSNFTSNVDNLKSLTHNKIFRHMAIFLFNNSDIVLDNLRQSLISVIEEPNTETIDELMNISKKSIINPFVDNLKDNKILIDSHELKNIFGKEIMLKPTSHQLSSFNMLKKIYKTEEDIINKFIYHLRPKNTIFKIEYKK